MMGRQGGVRRDAIVAILALGVVAHIGTAAGRYGGAGGAAAKLICYRTQDVSGSNGEGEVWEGGAMSAARSEQNPEESLLCAPEGIHREDTKAALAAFFSMHAPQKSEEKTLLPR